MTALRWRFTLQRSFGQAPFTSAGTQIACGPGIYAPTAPRLHSGAHLPGRNGNCICQASKARRRIRRPDFEGAVPMPGYRRGFSTRRRCLFEAFTAVTATEGVFHVSTIDSPDRIIRHPIRARLAPAALFRGSSANAIHRLTSYQFPSARNRSDSSAGSPVNASRKNSFNFPFFSAGSPNGECDSCTQEASVRLM